jgi:DHA1 family bicyclomycin/chloramphenicol resistance-like MFS transporter
VSLYANESNRCNEHHGSKNRNIQNLEDLKLFLRLKVSNSTMPSRHNTTLIIWILGALATVSPFAIDLYLPAFSQIAADFHTNPAQISLSISSYFIGMAAGQILYGPLLDRFGRKKPLYVGLVVFILASVSCMLSQTVQSLVAFRFFQALGGSVAWVAAVAMVRDFFPVKESARVFSLLILILGVSPLLAPTFGGLIAIEFGWKAIFFVLAIIGGLILVLTFLFLPVGYQPDRGISLKPKPIIKVFLSVLRHGRFFTYTFAGAFSFATLFIYVAGSPVIFLDIFKVTPPVYGGIFALLSVSFIGGSQLNIFLTKKFSSERLFRSALILQIFTSFVFLAGSLYGWFNLYSTIAVFFIVLGALGICNPNANALALAPFTQNIGSASALLGCTQIGIAALASSGVAFFNAQNTIPIAGLMAVTGMVGGLILWVGERRIKGEKVPVNKDSEETACKDRINPH